MIVQGHHTPEGRPHVDCGIEIPEPEGGERPWTFRQGGESHRGPAIGAGMGPAQPVEHGIRPGDQPARTGGLRERKDKTSAGPDGAD